jgi:hypothetical protein
MKPSFIFAWILLIASCGYSQITFNRRYDLGGTEKAFTVVQTFDSGFAVCGMKGAGIDQRVFLFRTDKSGDGMWSKEYEDYVYSHERIMQATHDSGFIICSNENGMIHLIKTGQNGDTLWTSRPASGSATGIAETSDHGFVISSEDVEVVGLTRTDSSGSLTWHNTYRISEGNKNADIRSVVQTSDGGFAATGECDPLGFPPEQTSAYLLKVSDSGDSLWCKKYTWSGQLISGYSLCQTTDNGYTLTGTSAVLFNSNTIHGQFIRTDANGDTLWTRRTSPPRVWLSSSAIAAGQSIISCGRTDNPYAGGGWAMMLWKESLDGKQGVARIFSSGDAGNSVCTTSDAGFAMVGERDGDIILVKTDSAGYANPFSVEELPVSRRLSVFPNPAPGIFTVSLSTQDRILEVVDGQVRCVSRKVLTGQPSETIDLSTQPKGIYLIRVAAAGEVLTAKVILR